MDEAESFAAMTVNERLAKLGLFEEFDAAVISRDEAAVVAILLRAHLTDRQAQQTTRALFASPGKYGFK
jgi:hypothetical protein